MSIPKATGSLGPRTRPATPSRPTTPTPEPSIQSTFVDPDGNRTKLTFEISSDLHRRFKTASVANGEKMRDVLEELIEQWTVEKEKNR